MTQHSGNPNNKEKNVWAAGFGVCARLLPLTFLRVSTAAAAAEALKVCYGGEEGRGKKEERNASRETIPVSVTAWSGAGQ